MAARSYRQRCLVLKKTKLGETDAILTMLADDGHQVRAVAKGLRKPGNRIGARLEPFSKVDLLLHRGRSLDVVGETRTVRTHAACREQLEKTAACAAVAEFLEKVTRDGAVAGPRVFALTSAAFDAIGAGAAEEGGLLAAAHLVKAVSMLGFRPALRECALCGAPLDEPARFDVAAGGTLCADCAAQLGGSGVDLVLVRWVDALLGSTFSQVAGMADAPVRPLLDFCESWVREHLSLNLRSLGFLKSLY